MLFKHGKGFVLRVQSSVTFLRSVFLLKLCSKECLGFGGEIMKFENMNNQLRRKRKERED